MMLRERLMALLLSRKGDQQPGHAVDKYVHSLQCATRARRAGADDYWIVAALFHDVFGGFFPLSHGNKIADVLAPFMPVYPYRMALQHHETMMLAHWDPTAPAGIRFREVHEQADWFPHAARFADEWDAPSFDPGYKHDRIESFHAVIAKVVTE